MIQLKWIKEVQVQYLKLTELDVAPNDLHDWAGEIECLAGSILDISLWLENSRGNGALGESEIWLINNGIRQYNESLEKLKKIEENIDF